MMSLPQQQRGVALVTALLIVAVAVLLATNLAWEQNMDLRRTETLLNHERAVHAALGAETLVIQLIQSADSDLEADVYNDGFFQELVFPFEGGGLVAEVEDLNARFNLNNLVTTDDLPDEAVVRQFRALLRLLSLDEEIAGAVVDWIDQNQSVCDSCAQGAEDDFYTGLNPPYRAANRSMTSVSELLSVRGVGPEEYRILRPWVTALPPGTRVNVNTACSAVLASFARDADLGQGDNWLQERGDEGFVDHLESMSDAADPELLANQADIISRYMGVTTTVSIGTSRLAMYSLLERIVTGDTATLVARQRTFGLSPNAGINCSTTTQPDPA